MSGKSLIGALVTVVVVVGGYYLLRGHTGGQPEAAMSPEESAMVEMTPLASDSEDGMMTEKTGDEVMTMEGDVKVFTVHGGAFYFNPKEISVDKGDKVKIVLVDDGGFHDFVIDELNVKTPRLQNAGDTATVEFTADRTGSFQYYCSVGSHRAQGMWGTLTVK